MTTDNTKPFQPKRIVAHGMMLYEFVEDEGKYILVAAVDTSDLDVDPDKIADDFFARGQLPVGACRFGDA